MGSHYGDDRTLTFDLPDVTYNHVSLCIDGPYSNTPLLHNCYHCRVRSDQQTPLSVWPSTQAMPGPSIKIDGGISALGLVLTQSGFSQSAAAASALFASF
jgi:hypothetical protein